MLSSSKRVNRFISFDKLRMISAVLLVSTSLLAEDKLPVFRVFFSDAKLSFTAPFHWELHEKFPFGPLFFKKTQGGFPTTISCAISSPLEENRLSYDISMELLKSLAEKQLADGHPQFRKQESRERELLGRHVYEITWEEADQGQPVRTRSVYFYIDNRIYNVSLRGHPDSFKWLATDFESWLESIRLLSRENSGFLATPAKGGIWVHQTAGIKVPFDRAWLIGACDDRMIGATIVEGLAHADLVCTVEPRGKKPEIGHRERKDLRKANRKKGMTLLSEKNASIGTSQAYEMEYRGTRGERAVQGKDVLLATPKSLVLLNFETDAALYTRYLPDFDKMLRALEAI